MMGIGFTADVREVLKDAAESNFFSLYHTWEEYPIRSIAMVQDWKHRGRVEVLATWDGHEHEDVELTVLVHRDDPEGYYCHTQAGFSSKDTRDWPALDLLWGRAEWQAWVEERTAELRKEHADMFED